MTPKAGILLLVLLAAAFAPTASAEHPAEADPETFAHLNLDVQELAPGASISHHLLSPEGPLRAGWIYIIYGGVQAMRDANDSAAPKAHIVVNLTHGDGEITERFVWTEGAFHKNSTKIQVTGDHELVLWNPTNTTVRYAFYYDQSCNCVGKAIPLDGGFVLFNHKFQAGRAVQYDLYVYEETITLKGALAAYDPTKETANWPEDFEVLDEKTVAGKDWLNFSFTPDETATYYVFYEAVQGASPQSRVHLTPIIEVEKGSNEAPGAAFLPLIVFAVLIAAFLRRRS